MTGVERIAAERQRQIEVEGATTAREQLLQDDLYRIVRALDIPALPYSGHEAMDRDILPRIAALTAERDALRAREEAHMRVVVAAGRVRDEALAERDAAVAANAALVEALTDASTVMEAISEGVLDPTFLVRDWWQGKYTRYSQALAAQGAAGAAMLAVERIAAERQRQIEVEGASVAGDAAYTHDELAAAAVCYATPERFRSQLPALWPWDERWWKPSPENRIRELEKAGALIAAEIDRLERAQAVPS